MSLLNKVLIILLSLTIGYNSSVHARETYVLTGYMGVQGGESFSYRLELKDSTGDYLSGYSYLFKTKGNEVKTAVVVKRDKFKKSLFLKETDIIYNNNFKSKAVICLVESNLQTNIEEQNLKGTLTTQTINNGGMCSTGSILFTNKVEIDKLFSDPIVKQDANDQKPSNNFYKPPSVSPTKKLNQLMAENKRKENELAILSEKPTVSPVKKVVPPTLPPAKITEGHEVIYDWQSNKVIFTIWDGSQEDGDRVTVSFNNLQVLADYTLRNEQKTMELSLNKEGINTITISALNEGGQPPNTANITIQDGEKTYEIIAYNKIGKKALIKIRMKK